MNLLSFCAVFHIVPDDNGKIMPQKKVELFKVLFGKISHDNPITAPLYANFDENAEPETIRRSIARLMDTDVHSVQQKRFSKIPSLLRDGLNSMESFELYLANIDKWVSNCSEQLLYNAVQEIMLILSDDSPFSKTISLLYNQRSKKRSKTLLLAWLIIYFLFDKHHEDFFELYNITSHTVYQRFYSESIPPEDVDKYSDLYRLQKPLSTQILSSNKVCKEQENDLTMPQAVYEEVLVNCNFVGRAEELRLLKKKLHSYKKVFVYGMGGIGKSELAREFAYRSTDKFIPVFLYYTSSIMNLVNNMTILELDRFERTICNGIPESDKSFFKRKMRYIKTKFGENYLFVIDNFDTDYDEDLEEFLKGTYSVIITTRHNFEHLGLPVIPIKELSTHEQVQLFCKFSRLEEEKNKEEIEELLSLFEGHTLTLLLTANFLFQKQYSLSALIRLLENDGISRNIKGTIRLGYAPPQRVYNIISSLFKLEKLSEDEKEIMICMTLIPLSGINITLFMKLIEAGDGEKIISLCLRNWIQYDRETGSISLHPIITAVVAEELSLKAYSERFLINYSKEIENAWESSLSCKTLYRDISERIIKKIEFSAHYYELFLKIATLFRYIEHYDKSFHLLKKCLHNAEESFGSDSVQTAEVYYELACHYFDLNDEKIAENYIQSAIDIMDRKAPVSLKAAIYLKYKAWILLDSPHPAHLAQVQDLLERTKSILHVIKRNEHQFASLYSAYAYYYFYIGKVKTALRFADKSYHIFSELYGDLNPDTLSPLTFKSTILAKLGEMQAAEEIARKVVDLQKKLFPDTHITVMRRKAGLAAILIENHKAEEAKAILSEEINILREKGIENGVFIKRVDDLYTQCLQKESEVE